MSCCPGLSVRLDRQAVVEKRGWDCGTEDGRQTWYESAQCIEYGHHLRRVTVAMSGDGTPNYRHSRVLNKLLNVVLGSSKSSTYPLGKRAVLADRGRVGENDKLFEHPELRCVRS